MQVAVRWSDWHGKGLEHCQCLANEAGLLLAGVVAGTRGSLYGASYYVKADASGHTREVRVAYVGGKSLHVEADGEGNWFDLLGKAPIPALKGCLDVDIGVTPATNMLPVRRLKLNKDEAREIRAAYVPLPTQIAGTFLPILAGQRYTCLIPDRRYRYEGLFRNFSGELEFDAHGLVLDYPDTFRRISAD